MSTPPLFRCFNSMIDNALTLTEDMGKSDLSKAFDKANLLQMKIVEKILSLKENSTLTCTHCTKNCASVIKENDCDHCPAQTIRRKECLAVNGCIRNIGESSISKNHDLSTNLQLAVDMPDRTGPTTAHHGISMANISPNDTTSVHRSTNQIVTSNFPGRQKLDAIVQSHWTFSVCLLPSPHIDTIPSDRELSQWSECGMGITQCRVPNLISLSELQTHICSLYPRVPQLTSVGFRFCYGLKDDSIQGLKCKDTRQLKIFSTSGIIYLRPGDDLCSLPPSDVEESGSQAHSLGNTKEDEAVASQACFEEGDQQSGSSLESAVEQEVAVKREKVEEEGHGLPSFWLANHSRSPFSLVQSTEEDSCPSDNSNHPYEGGLLPHTSDNGDVIGASEFKQSRHRSCACSFCGNQFTRRDSLHRHLITCPRNPRRTKKRYQCLACHTVYRHVRYLRDHCLLKHNASHTALVKEVDEEQNFMETSLAEDFPQHSTIFPVGTELTTDVLESSKSSNNVNLSVTKE